MNAKHKLTIIIQGLRKSNNILIGNYLQIGNKNNKKLNP